MATLIPKATTCHTLQLPTTEKDDRLNLNVRTGSASTLFNSLVFAFGGLTIGLEVYEQTISELFETFNSKILNSNSKFKSVSKYLSGEFFYLNLLERNWSRVVLERDAPRPKPRLFHELCALNNCVYMFGGLVIPDTFDEFAPQSPKNFLVPCNDLWEFNLESSTWKLLHDGSNYQTEESVPIPRFNHKMTAIKSLSFVNKKDHFGIFIAGGKDHNSASIYDNVVFDLVEGRYVGQEAFELKINNDRDSAHNCLSVDSSNSIIITFQEEVDHLHHHHQKVKNDKLQPPKPQSLTNQNLSLQNLSPSEFLPSRGGKTRNDNSTRQEESIIVYTSTKTNNPLKIENPLTSFKLGKSIRTGKEMPIHRTKAAPSPKNETNIAFNKKVNDTKVILHTIPFNLRYPTGGIFGQNVVITGFLPDEYDISIFIYNKPTGKWSRLNIFCNHDYGSHRFWGGYVWQSHHKVVLIGNFVTSRTTSSIRFFTSMLTVSLPVTNILASSEIAGGNNQNSSQQDLSSPLKQDTTSAHPTEESVTDDSTCSSNLRTTSDEENYLEVEPDPLKKQPRKFSTQSQTSNKTSPTTISFSDYVHYAAPKTNFTKIRSVFPPAAITLGRNAFDRYGDLISDFEIVSSNGDRIPVSMVVLMERWGRYFIELLARAYVNAVDKFEADQLKAGDKFETSNKGLRSSKSSASSKQDKGSIGGLSENSSDGSSGTETPKKLSKSTNTSSVPSMASNPTTPDDTKESNRNSFYISLPIPASKSAPKEAPQFRLPFQDTQDEQKKKVETEEASPSSISKVPQLKTLSQTPSATPSDSSLATTPSDEVAPATAPTPPTAVASTNTLAVVDTQKLRKDSISSFSSNNSLLTSHLQDIPPQLPLPNEQIPAVPATPTSFRQSSSRKNSSDLGSPRASLIHTLSQLRNINVSKSPMGSPFASPRASLSAQGTGSGQNGPAGSLGGALAVGGLSSDPLVLKRRGSTGTFFNDEHSTSSERKPGLSKLSSFTSIKAHDTASRKTWKNIDPEIDDDDDVSFTGDQAGDASNPNAGHFENALLDFDNLQSGKFRMEPSLIPRKLYIPFSSITLKAFCEYLYTGQVGNKWLLVPTALDNLGIAKFFKVPLLYDLISEVLFGIIGRKEAHIIKEGNNLKKKYCQILDAANTPFDSGIKFPLDEYEGFMETVDDGFLDVALLKKSSNIHKNSSVFSSRRKSSRRESAIDAESVSRKDSETLDSEDRKTIKEEVEKKKDGEGGASEEKPSESTDDSSDKKTNSEEDFDFDLAFLESYDQNTLNTDFRSRSVFDKAKGLSENFGNAMQDPEDAELEEKQHISTLTLEELVSPDSNIPSDCVIDHIYETAAIVIDMKLMLRASNVRQMNRILIQTKIDVERSIASMKEKKLPTHVEKEKTSEKDGLKSVSQSQSATPPLASHKSEGDIRTTKLFTTSATSSAPLSPRSAGPAESQSSEPGKLRTSLSSVSISNSAVGALKSSSASIAEKSRSNSGFRSISGLVPFKQKSDPKNSNKELDKRITKMIKEDEKIKSKNEKERIHSEKLEKLVSDRAAKKEKKRGTVSSGTSSGGTFPVVDRHDLSRASSQSNLLGMSVADESTNSFAPAQGLKKHHTFFHLGHKKVPAGTTGSSGIASPASGTPSTGVAPDSASEQPSRLTRTNSSSGSLQSVTSKQSEKRKVGLFGLKRSS